MELLPSQPGNYKLTLMYGGETLQGSPFNFSVSSGGSKSDRAAGHGLEVCHRNKEASFIVYCPIAPNVQIERIDEFGERIEPKIKVSLLTGFHMSSYRILKMFIKFRNFHKNSEN